MTTTLKLYATPLSHFGRKVRILLAELGLPYDIVRGQTVMATSGDTFGDNPLMRVPTLVHEGRTVFDSDHIARYLVSKFDPSDRFDVRTDAPEALNQLAVTSGIMGNEVTILLAKRGGLDITGAVYFDKLAIALEQGLVWLDRTIDVDAERFDWRDVALVSMWQHVVHYKFLPEPDRYARIARRVARFADRPSVASTTPEASLVEAKAAGWSPPP